MTRFSWVLHLPKRVGDMSWFFLGRLLFSLQMDRWDVFAGTKHTCDAFSLHLNGVFRPSISQPPASNVYPRRRTSPTNRPPLSATHRFSVAQIKDLSDIILSHVSPRRRFSKTRNLMFRLTSIDISLWISLTHAPPHPTLSFERRPCGMTTAHRLRQAGAAERTVLQVNRCCLFVYFVGKRLLERCSQSEKYIDNGKKSTQPRRLCFPLLTFDP